MANDHHGHDSGHDHRGGSKPDWAARMQRLNDTGRLTSHLSEADLARLLSLRGDEEVLDLGSGTGFYTDRIAPLTSGKIYALEIVPEMLAHYRERGLPGNVRLVHGDMTDLSANETIPGAGLEATAAHDLGSETMDVAITIATWHEIDGRFDASGAARLLRPDGRLIVVDWRKDPESWEYGPPDEVRYTTDEVAETLGTDFNVLSVEDVGPSMFALSAKRA